MDISNSQTLKHKTALTKDSPWFPWALDAAVGKPPLDISHPAETPGHVLILWRCALHSDLIVRLQFAVPLSNPAPLLLDSFQQQQTVIAGQQTIEKKHL